MARRQGIAFGDRKVGFDVLGPEICVVRKRKDRAEDAEDVVFSSSGFTEAPVASSFIECILCFSFMCNLFFVQYDWGAVHVLVVRILLDPFH